MSSIFGGMKRKRAIEEDTNTKKKPNAISKVIQETEEKSNEFKGIDGILKQQKKDDGKMRTEARNALNKAAKIGDLRHYNKLILDFGNTRGLYGYAVSAFTELLENKLKPNEFTFSNLLNACARASEIGPALEYWGRMEEFGITKDEIHYTVMMKCYCNVGQLDKAINLLADMRTARLYPNIRTYQTLIRECMHNCNDEVADKLIEELNFDGIDLSISILEHMCKLKVSLLKVKEAEKYYHLLLENQKKKDVVGSEVASIAVTNAKLSLALGYFLRNDIKKGRKYLEKAAASVDICKKDLRTLAVATGDAGKYGPPPGDKRKDFKNKHNMKKEEPKEEPKEKRNVFDRDSEFTSNQFLQLRITEAESELERLQKYVSRLASLQKMDENDIEIDEKMQKSQWSARGEVLEHGLGEAHRVYRSDKAVSWEKIFRNTQAVRVEVGSGTGEWLCERARKSPHINWVAIEMGASRVFSIWSRVQLMHLNNVVVVSGDAFESLQLQFAKKSVEQLYVNFPEPPVWARWVFRLLKLEFFQLCQRVLVKYAPANEEETNLVGDGAKGVLSVVTDDPGYVWLLSKEFAPEGGQSAHLLHPTGEDLFSTTLPLQYGSSFYDRFWDNGSKKRRFYFHLARVKQQK